MNVITVLSDEHSYQMMQFVDRKILRTPNLDRLAAGSVCFDACYSPCPVCAPARGAFFTGRYVNRIGTWDNSTPYDGTVPGISQHLAQYGVPTICIGKTHFHCDGHYGFAHEEYAGYMNHGDIGCFFRDQRTGRINAEKRYSRVSLKAEPSYDDKVLAASLAWLEKNAGKSPFLLYVGFLDPHFPFRVRREHWDYYSQRITQVPPELRPPYAEQREPLNWLQTYFKTQAVTEAEVLRLLIGYHCAVEELDERIGALLDAVERLGLAQNTAFLYSSDHGEQMGYHGMWWKCCMYEQSAHIPLLMRIPGLPPRRVAQPVNLVDLFPTLCDLEGVPRPEGIDGQSLLPLARTGQDAQRSDFTFSEYHAHGMPRGMFMIRWKNWKYVHYCGYAPQLFDLAADPQENCDLAPRAAGDEAVREALAQCRARLASVCDPDEVDARAREFQSRMKRQMGVTTYENDFLNFVLHPEAAPASAMPGAHKGGK